MPKVWADHAGTLEISGARGEHKNAINGIYILVPAPPSRDQAPVYKRRGRLDSWLYLSKMKFWVVSEECEMKGRSSTSIFASKDTVKAGTMPQDVKVWEQLGKPDFVINEDVEVNVIEESSEEESEASDDCGSNEEKLDEDEAVEEKSGEKTSAPASGAADQTHNESSGYKIINGKKYDSKLMHMMEGFAEDGEIDADEAKEVWKEASKGPEVSAIAIATLKLGPKMYNFTAEAREMIKSQLQEIDSRTAKRQTTEPEEGAPNAKRVKTLESDGIPAYTEVFEDSCSKTREGASVEIVAEEVSQAVSAFIKPYVEMPGLGNFLELISNKTLNFSWMENDDQWRKNLFKFDEAGNTFVMCSLLKEEKRVESGFWFGKKVSYKFTVKVLFSRIVPANEAACQVLRKLMTRAGSDLSGKIAEMHNFVKPA